MWPGNEILTKINRFMGLAGCDGHQKGRSYYTEVAETLPTRISSLAKVSSKDTIGFVSLAITSLL